LGQFLLFADSLDAKMIHMILEKDEMLKAVLDVEEVESDDELPFSDEPVKKKRHPLKGVDDPAERELIHEALKILAAKDPTQARTKDGVGFSKWDSFLGHRLANEHELTPRAAAVGKRIAAKYKRQLEGLYNQLFPEKENS